MPQPGPDNNFVIKFGAIFGGLLVLLFILLMSSMLGPIDVPHHSETPVLTPVPTTPAPAPTPTALPLPVPAPSQTPTSGNLEVLFIILPVAVFIISLTMLSLYKLAQDFSRSNTVEPAPALPVPPAPRRMNVADAHLSVQSHPVRQTDHDAWHDFMKRKEQAREFFWYFKAMETREADARSKARAAQQQAPQGKPDAQQPATGRKVAAVVRNSQSIQANARKSKKLDPPDRDGGRNGKVNKPGPGKRRR